MGHAPVLGSRHCARGIVRGGCHDAAIELPPPDQPLASALVGIAVAAVEIFFAFDTDVGTGSAFLVLRPDETAKWGMRARLVATTMTGLHCNPAPPVSRRGYEPAQPGESWIEYRQRVRNLDYCETRVRLWGGG